MAQIKRLRITEVLENHTDKDGNFIAITTLAKKIGVSHNTLLAYDRGKYIPRYDVVLAICEEMSCSQEELTEFEPDCLGERILVG